MHGRSLLRRLVRHSSTRVGLGVVAALLAFALLGPLLSSADPNLSDFSLSRDARGGPPGPSASHWLGTDPLFRDLLARLAHGARLSLLIGAGATLLTLAVGTGIGLLAGYLAAGRHDFGFALAGRRLTVPLRWIDPLLMRFVDVAMAFPFLLLVTAIGVAVGRSDAVTVTLVLGLTAWTGTARLVRSKTIEVERADFVDAARAMGASHARIVTRHILPVLAPTLLVIGSQAVAQMVLAEAVLSYLTVGISPPQATWGRMLHEAEGYVGVRLLLVAAPGFAILLTVLGFTRLGDGLREVLLPTGPDAMIVRRGRKVPTDLVVVFAALMVAASAGPRPPGAPIDAVDASGVETPARGGTLRVATMVNIRALDPALAYDEASATIDQHVFDRLLQWDEHGALVPALATSYEQSADGRGVRFVLRPGVRFHDGTLLGAADVKRSLERCLHPATPSPAASLYRMIEGYDAYRTGRAEHLSGIVVEDERIVAFQLVERDATFPSLLTLGCAAPVCPSSGRTVDTRAPAPPCGTGPFRVESWDRAERVMLKRFDDYYLPGQPYLEAIEWLLNVPPLTQRYRFELGELDYVRELSVADTALFESDLRWRSRGRWVAKPMTTGIFLNTEREPFDDVHVRRAVAFAIDPSVLEKVRPNVQEADRMVPLAIPGPDRSEPMRRHDITEALREMTLAGFPFDPSTGSGGYPDVIDYITVPDTFDQAAAEIFQQQLARIGVRIRLRLVSYATWLAEVSTRGKAAMGWTGWHADFPDPSNFFVPILTTAAIADEGSHNVAFFSNAELDELMERAGHEPDGKARMQLFLRAEEIVRDEAPWIPVYTARSFELWHPYVRGYVPHPLTPMRFTEAWLAPGRVRAAPTDAEGGAR